MNGGQSCSAASQSVPMSVASSSAERAGAKVAVLQGAGHWWMCQQPVQAADAINAFLANLN